VPAVEPQQLDDPAALPDVENLSEAELRKLGAPSDEIVDAFKVSMDMRENSEWWRQRMSGAKRNKHLVKARIRAGKSSEGGQRIQSSVGSDVDCYLFDSGQAHAP
jgi:hypothetical protein